MRRLSSSTRPSDRTAVRLGVATSRSRALPDLPTAGLALRRLVLELYLTVRPCGRPTRRGDVSFSSFTRPPDRPTWCCFPRRVVLELYPVVRPSDLVVRNLVLKHYTHVRPSDLLLRRLVLELYPTVRPSSRLVFAGIREIPLRLTTATNREISAYGHSAREPKTFKNQPFGSSFSFFLNDGHRFPSSVSILNRYVP